MNPISGNETEPGPCQPLTLDTTRPNPARRYNYWLGGKDNVAADRTSGDTIAATFTHIRTAAVENRRFLERVVTFLAAERGIRQFVDIGTGIPTKPYLHDIAARHRPDVRVLYIDNDEMVGAWARAWLTAQPPAASGYLDADLRHPDAITGADELATVLDLNEPVALLMIAVLHFLADTDEPAAIIDKLASRLAPGSYLALSHATFDPLPTPVIADLNALADPASGNGPFHARTHDQVYDLLAGRDLVEPGLVSIADWRPDLPPAPQATPEQVACYGVVAELN